MNMNWKKIVLFIVLYVIVSEGVVLILNKTNLLNFYSQSGYLMGEALIWFLPLVPLYLLNKYYFDKEDEKKKKSSKKK